MKYQNKILQDGVCIDDAAISREKAIAIQTLLAGDKPTLTLAPKMMPFIIERDGHKLTGRVETSANGIEIYFDNYGTTEAATGYGGVVFAEPGDDGHPVVHIFGRITHADPTHSIALDEAAEHWRDNAEQPNPDCHCEICSHSD